MPPGAPNWGLPPPATPMIWQGLTDAQLCGSIKGSETRQESQPRSTGRATDTR